MATFTKIKFGDGLGVTDEGAGVIRVDAGGGVTSGSLAGRITAEPTLWAYWPLTDVSGNAVDRVAGRDLTPTAFGGYPVYGQPGPFTLSTDTSIEFSGTNGTSGNGSYFHRTTTGPESAAVFASRQAFTIELLVYPTVAQAAGLFTYAVGTTQSHRLSIDASNRIEFMRSSVDFITGPGLPMNTWTHIAATYDGSTMLLYVNGSLAGSLASTSNGATGGQDIELGMYGNSPFSFLKGRLAQVAVYTSALSATTIAQHASADITSISPGYAGPFTVVTKTVDESVASSTLIQDDDELFFATVSGAFYEVQAYIIYGSPVGTTTPDMRGTLGEDAVDNRGLMNVMYVTSVDVPNQTTFFTNTGSAAWISGTQNVDRAAYAYGYHRGNGGTFRFLWAQNTSTAGATIVRAGSQLRYRRIV